MQNGTPNGTSQHHERVTPEPKETFRVSPNPEPSDDILKPTEVLSEQNNDDTSFDTRDEPPAKKRRLTESNTSQRSTPRLISPPWKRAGAEGPTSFIEGGRRKSSRTNTLPLDLQPASGKRHTRAVQKEYAGNPVTNRQRSSPLASTPTRAETSGRRSLGTRSATNGTVYKSPRREPVRKPSSRLSVSGVNHASAPAPTKSVNTRTRAQSSVQTANRATPAVNGSGPRYTRRKVSTSTNTSPSTARDLDKYGEVSDKAYGLDGSQETSRDQKLPRLRFKLRKPSLGILGIHHPAHVLPPKRYSSFREWIASSDAVVGEGVVLTKQDAQEEASKRLKVLEAGEPGGLLTPEVCSACLPEPQEEPPPQYSHQDHLVAHALFFRKLLDQEHKRHRNTARLFAQWCAEAYRKRNKRPEDILREQQEEIKSKRRQLIRDLQKQFDLVRAEVDKARLARWEEERKAENQQALDQALEKSTLLFAKRRQDIYGAGESDMDGTSEDVEGEDDDDESVSDEDESNMSTSNTESEADDVADDDEALTAEELRLKYANLPGTDLATEQASDTSVVSSPRNTPQLEDDLTEDDVASQNPSFALSTPNADLEEVDPMLLDGSDESTDMDDDMGESDEGDQSEDEDEDDNDSRDSDDGPGLLGFFPRDALVDNDGRAEADEGEDEDNLEDQDEVSLVPTGPPEGDEESGLVSDLKDATEVNGIPETEPSDMVTPPTDMDVDKLDEPAESNGDKLNEPAEDVVENPREAQSREDSSQASPETIATKPSDPESLSSYEAPVEKPMEATSSPTPVGLKTPIPHLLRGTLREYQHYGLDWLAGLYTNHINGILADEMGLGKTIQTIALLAHLAVEHEVWGPHLVVVPTSVILNWEMEFKKWCPGFKIMTYYGNQDERKQKRRGWTDDSSWDVLITSYQLVLQDQQVLKRRNWHYMVLDEAHNIKNFRSQRWQALLTFKTRARLLLTGTPLQNNLTELWSLLFFLMPSDGDDAGVEGFADLKNFSEWFRRPVEQILEHGREIMDDEAKKVVTKLHTVLRPYLLRRLKADVEKQMPGKYEHVVHCRLSKRQRYLYDGFMSRAQTKETLASGNYLSIINCLMQLRKVCNHPDLFETRQISTSFAMSKSVASDYEIKETLVRRRLLYQHPFDRLDLDFLNLAPISREDLSRRLVEDSSRIMAFEPLKTLRECQYKRTNWRMQFDGSSTRAALECMENDARKKRMSELESSLYFESKRHGRRPVWGKSLIDFLTIQKPESGLSSRGARQVTKTDQLANQSSILASMILSVEERARAMEGYIQKFACLTPAATAAGTLEATLVPLETRYFNQELRYPEYDPFHEAQMRLSIAFPDKRLLQYDCGKLQRLANLLRDLQAGGHRALIFTQMTKMLDILEQFLNIHGHRYLRLDGTTKVEQRQMLTERFNNDNRILAFILSTRSGGLGINLTGADTVIFYDLDWNPAMDKQCQDRCHRIGQTRDVHIYRFVSEHTIESNILRKANQKRMLDDVVIQEGEFTTDYFTKLDVREMIDDDVVDGQDEASKAMDRVLDTRTRGGASAASTRVFEPAEDKEDIDAARTAEKELRHADDGDFEEHIPTPAGGPTNAGTPAATPGPDQESSLLADEDLTTEPPQPAHIDDYLLRFMEWNVRDQPLQLPADKIKKKSKKGGKAHRVKRRR